MSYPRLAGEVEADGVDQASARGYAAGYAAGARAAAGDAEVEAAALSSTVREREIETAEAVRSALSALQSAATLAGAARRPVIEEADAALASAAIELAEAILGKELENHESSARAAVARALAVAATDEVLVVRMNPADIAILAGEADALTSARLVGDESLLRGDAVLETPVGTIDARLSATVERVRAILLGGAS
jgi:flagellar assembly protein FliH